MPVTLRQVGEWFDKLQQLHNALEGVDLETAVSAPHQCISQKVEELCELISKAKREISNEKLIKLLNQVEERICKLSEIQGIEDLAEKLQLMVTDVFDRNLDRIVKILKTIVVIASPHLVKDYVDIKKRLEELDTTIDHVLLQWSYLNLDNAVRIWGDLLLPYKSQLEAMAALTRILDGVKSMMSDLNLYYTRLRIETGRTKVSIRSDVWLFFEAYKEARVAGLTLEDFTNIFTKVIKLHGDSVRNLVKEQILKGQEAWLLLKNILLVNLALSRISPDRWDEYAHYLLGLLLSTVKDVSALIRLTEYMHELSTKLRERGLETLSLRLLRALVLAATRISPYRKSTESLILTIDTFVKNVKRLSEAQGINEIIRILRPLVEYVSYTADIEFLESVNLELLSVNKITEKLTRKLLLLC